MLEMKEVLTKVENGLGIITIHRPEVRNALNSQVIRKMEQTLQAWREDDRVQLVVFTGAGEKSFVSGADIAELNRRTFRDGLAAALQGFYDEVEQYEKPTIAAVNGYALGGGCELAMACDLRIAQENARFGLPELHLSILPGAGGTQRLARLVGKGRAMDMILTGSVIDAREAEQIGLVSRVVPRGHLMEEVRKVAKAILSKGPLAVRLAKMVVHAGFEADQRTGMILEKLAQSLLYTTEDMREGTTAFLEKRKPSFKGQ